MCSAPAAGSPNQGVRNVVRAVTPAPLRSDPRAARMRPQTGSAAARHPRHGSSPRADAAAPNAGARGSMFSPRRPVRTPLRLERLEGRDVPAALTPAEAFNQTLVGDLPAGWVQWATAGSTPFAVSPDRPYSGPGGLAITGNSRITARAWVDQPTAADSGARATVLVDSLEPVEVIARGHDLGGTRPTYYAVTVARGLDVQLVRVVEGQATVL